MGSVVGMLERQMRPLVAARGQRSEVRSLAERIAQMKITLKNSWFLFVLAAIIGAGLGW